MKLQLKDKTYNVEIIKKRTTRNTYIRVKDDLTIAITANTWTSDKEIEKVIISNQQAIVKMIEKQETRKEKKEKFYYLGKEYDVIYTATSGVSLGTTKVFVNKSADLDKWYKKEASTFFQERLDYLYNHFSRNIPYPTLTIRKMTSRWGVCNTKDKRVTLNLELMRKNPECLDYVIIHELSHLIHPNHSTRFWELVGENYPNYKEIRKTMKE